MLRSPKDLGYMASASQPPAWPMSDGGTVVPADNANVTAACVYQAGWPYSYRPIATTNTAIPLVLPFGTSPQPLCQLPLPWTNYTWPPLPQSLPRPVVVSPTTGLRFPAPSPVGIEQASGLSLPAVHHASIVSVPVPTNAMPLVAQPAPYRCSATGSEVNSEVTTESTELKSPVAARRQPSTEHGKVTEEEEDGEVDVEGSSTGTDTSDESTCFRPLASQCHQYLEQSISQCSRESQKSIQMSSIPSRSFCASQSTGLDDRSPATSRNTMCVTGAIQFAPTGQSAPPAMQYNASGIASSKGMHRPLLPDIATNDAKNQVRLAFNVTRGQASPEQGCSVCGTLSCGSRSANRGQDTPPRRQYFSCKVARRRLLEWIELHKDNPYPTKAQRTQLLKETGMNRVQLQNWLGNHRRRLKAQRCADQCEAASSQSSESS